MRQPTDCAKQNKKPLSLTIRKALHRLRIIILIIMTTLCVLDFLVYWTAQFTGLRHVKPVVLDGLVQLLLSGAI